MTGETIRLTAADGHALDAYLARPSGSPRAGLVVIQEIFGVNSHIRAVTDGFAADGFLAVAPALFDRVERGVELGYEADDMTKGRALRPQVSLDQAAMDVTAAVGAVGEAGKVGVIGYCWGGTVAWLAACRCPVAAAVGYYGGHIHELSAETPGCPVELHFGEQDDGIPAENRAIIAAAHPEVPQHLYPADHGFNRDQRATYHAESARLARERSLAFLAKHLG